MRDIRELTREEVFEVYLAPAKERDDDGNEIDDMGEFSSMSHREASFMSLRGGGLSWLQSEKRYQDWLKQQRN